VVDISSVTKSRGPNSNTLAYAECALSTYDRSTSMPVTFLPMDQSSSNFFWFQCNMDGSRWSLLSIIGMSIHCKS